MPKKLIACVLVALIVSTVNAQQKEADKITVGPNDWPWWRGPNRNGVADPTQKTPLKWSDTENILWKAPVPGRGHGSPIVVGDQVFLATANHKDETQSVLCYDRKTGELLWQTEVHRGNFVKGGHSKSSLASSTLACDGERVFITFLNNKAIWATALGRDGKKLWQTKVTDYILHQGFASSPTVYDSLLIVAADNKGAGVLTALDRATGKTVWKESRPQMPNYASPIILKTAGREQLFFIGCELVTSMDPLTGKKFWEIPGATTECVTSTVTDGRLIITSGGYPKNHVAAVHADGSGKTAWEVKTKVYVPSMIYHRDHLYAVQDDGFALCLKFGTGKEMWKERVAGPFSASPVLVGEHLFATNEAGRTFVFKASPDQFTLIAENQLGHEALSTPTFCGSRIYLRGAVREKGQRQEMLYCIGAANQGDR